MDRTPPKAANSQYSLEQSLPHYTREARARREMLMMAIKSETELYRSRIATYERELQEIERTAVTQLRMSDRR